MFIYIFMYYILYYTQSCGIYYIPRVDEEDRRPRRRAAIISSMINYVCC